MAHTEDIDTTGLLCPLPVLRISKRMRSLNPGDILRVAADDPAAAVDIPHFCREQGHALVSTSISESPMVFEIKKI